MSTFNNRHNIKSLLFDIVFDDERRAQELYDDIRRLHYEELEQVICKCLDQFAGTEAFARLGEIELDLGPIHYRDLRSSMGQKLYDSLSKKLKELFTETSKGKNLLVPSSMGQVELIRHFLTEGYLPWSSKENIVGLFENCLREESQAMLAMLKEIGKSEQVRRRLITRFDSTLILKVIQLSSPSNHVLIHQFHRQLTQLVLDNNISRLPKRKLEKELWFFILNHQLLQTSTANHTAILIKDTLMQFSDHFQYPFLKILFLMAEDLKQSRGVEIADLKNILSEISKDLNLNGLQRIDRISNYKQFSYSKKTQVLIHLLLNNSMASGMEHIRLGYLQQHLMQLLQFEPLAITELLQHPKKSNILIRRMINLFSIKPIIALVQSIEPSHYKTIINYQQNIIYIHQKNPFSSTTEKGFSDSLWEIIIHLLMNRSGSYFNQANFLKNVISRLSNHYSIDYHELIEKLRLVALQISAHTSGMPSFIRMLSELQKEFHGSGIQNNLEKQLSNKNKEASALEKNKALENHSDDQDVFLIQQRNRQAIEQYFLKKNDRQSLSLIRRLLIETLNNEPQLIIASLKKQANYLKLVEQLVQDFDETLIRELIKALEPVHYQSVIDYQKNTVLFQKKKQFIKTSESELSDALWNIILKILLSRSASKFNQKNFLKSLLSQTAIHYNIDYLQLIDELCAAINTANSESSSFHSFILLVQEIQQEEKALNPDRNSNQTKKAIPTSTLSKKDESNSISPKSNNQSSQGRVPQFLIELIVQGTAETKNALAERGFINQEEAIRHLFLYQKEALVIGLKKASSQNFQTFVAKLPTEFLSQLMLVSKSNYGHQIQDFLMLLNRRLYDFGFQQRQKLMQEISIKCLFLLLRHPNNFTQKLLKDLELILDQYPLPDSFYEQEESWKIPISGSLDSNIQDLEEKILRELANEQTTKSKTTLLLEEIIQSARQKPSHIPYTKNKKEMAVGQEIFIDNAGLVILNGYLNYFFERCELLDEAGGFQPEKAKHAALLLQYVFDPQTSYPEEGMVINKIICGLPINEVLPSNFEVSELEKEIYSQMLDAIISHWKQVSNSTHEGFRDSWIRREGKLTKKEDHWELLVEKRAFDILLDYIPFTLSPVRFNWMDSLIKVNWR